MLVYGILRNTNESKPYVKERSTAAETDLILIHTWFNPHINHTTYIFIPAYYLSNDNNYNIIHQKPHESFTILYDKCCQQPN